MKAQYLELNSQVNHILRSPPVVKGKDSKCYVKVPYMATVEKRPISKRFKILSIPKYHGNSHPHENLCFSA